MRETDFFKYIFFNVPAVLSVVAIILIAFAIYIGLRHRRQLMEQERTGSTDTMDASIGGKDQATIREIGLSSAGVGNQHYEPKKDGPK